MDGMDVPFLNQKYYFSEPIRFPDVAFWNQMNFSMVAHGWAMWQGPRMSWLGIPTEVRQQIEHIPKYEELNCSTRRQNILDGRLNCKFLSTINVSQFTTRQEVGSTPSIKAKPSLKPFNCIWDYKPLFYSQTTCRKSSSTSLQSPNFGPQAEIQ